MGIVGRQQAGHQVDGHCGRGILENKVPQVHVGTVVDIPHVPSYECCT